MKIATKKLSKRALVELVDLIREGSTMLPDHLILKFYRHDIINQLQGISEEFEKLGKELDKKRLSKKVREAKLDRYYRISDLGNKKLAMLKELDNATK